MIERSILAAAAALVLALVPVAAVARDGGNDRNEGRGVKTASEKPDLDHIPLVFHDESTMNVVQVVMLLKEASYVAVTKFGVDFDFHSDDLGDIPLLGPLFGPRYGAEDFTEDNRIGSVFRAGDDTLAVVLLGPQALEGYDTVLFNGDGSYEIDQGPRIVDVAPDSLSDFGLIPLGEQLARRQATQEAIRLLAGMTETTTVEADASIPFLQDIPLLAPLFVGTAHKSGDKKLMILIRPSIVVDSRES